MAKHFEELWVDAEKLAMDLLLLSSEHPEAQEDAIQNLLMDINNYRLVDGFDGKSPEGYVENGKKKIIGDMLLHIALLSAVDNIDVYPALQNAMESLTIRNYSKNESKNESKIPEGK